MRDELWFKHDARSRIDPKMSRFFTRHGIAGYGAFWGIIEVLHYQNDHEIDMDTEFEGVADQLRCEPSDLQLMINSLVEIGLLKLENRKLFQSRLKGDQAYRSHTLQASKASMSTGGRLGGLISGMKRRGATNEEIQEFIKGYEGGLQGSKGSNIDKNRIDKKEDINNKGDVKKSRPTLQVIFPEKWGPQAQSTFTRWTEYRVEIKRPLKTKSLQAQVDSFAENPRQFAALVERAIKNGWQGLNEHVPINGPSGSGAGPPQKQTNFDRNKEVARKILEECGHDTGTNDTDTIEI